ncbi:MAG: hypothetical protein WBA57_18430 [Elainellaceae cyanobacterium]
MTLIFPRMATRANITNRSIKFCQIKKPVLERIRQRYFHQLDESVMLENGVKMMIVSLPKTSPET